MTKVALTEWTSYWSVNTRHILIDEHLGNYLLIGRFEIEITICS